MKKQARMSSVIGLGSLLAWAAAIGGAVAFLRIRAVIPTGLRIAWP